MHLYRRPDGKIVPLFTAADYDRVCPRCGRTCTRFHYHGTEPGKPVRATWSDEDDRNPPR